jgi:cellulose synthase/poly-beta-1,6-N-acetylglucosamine synthase-like glycosyltransferase
VPSGSVIVPAFNEEGAIARSLQAASRLDYPAYEVIVVDDGSTDMTPFLTEGLPVSFVRLARNGGKALALNAGVARAKGDIIVFSDSDSWLHPSALRHLVGHFADPTVGAVAGMVLVDHPSSLLTRFQELEYIFGHALLKPAQIGSGASVTVCPGPVSAYRREALVAAGGVKGRTLTEDFDLTLDVLQRGFRIVYEPRAIAYTEAPTTWRALKQQRLRWSRGTLQVLRVHKHLLFGSRTGALGWFWLPYFLVFGYGGALLELGAILAFPLLAWASGHPIQLLKFATAYALMLESFNLGQYLVALVLSGQGRASLLGLALVTQPYRVWLNTIRLLALSREVRRAAVTWAG